MNSICKLLCLLNILALTILIDASWGAEKVKLRDISTLTFHQGRMSTGRRSSPIPQLMCVGGSAKNDHSQPAAVQCYNRGFDGFDVQWECKAQLPSNLKLGGVEVVCEGFDYPDDPYILKGSCGLEYEMEYINSASKKAAASSTGFKLADLLLVAIVVLLLYAVYIACRGQASRQFSPTDSDYPSGGDRPSGFGSAGGFASPSPPGFRSYPGDDSCSGGSSRRDNSGGGFWTGAAMGGALGYLFGNNRNQGTGYYSPGRSGYYDRPSSSASTSDAPSTSSGFGGTRRR